LPREISFKGAVQTLLAFAPALRQAEGEELARLRREVLRAMATHQVGDRPDRYEPRARKRRPKHYPQLNVPRAQAREALLSKRFRLVSAPFVSRTVSPFLHREGRASRRRLESIRFANCPPGFVHLLLEFAVKRHSQRTTPVFQSCRRMLPLSQFGQLFFRGSNPLGERFQGQWRHNVLSKDAGPAKQRSRFRFQNSL